MRSCIRRSAAPASVLLLLSVASAAIPPHASIPTEAIQPHIEKLASPELRGRMAGEPENEVAARYIADWFKRSGLQPLGTRRQKDAKAPLDGSGYFQPFEFQLGRDKGPGNRLSAAVGKATHRLRPGRDFDPTASSGVGKGAGEAVFVGFGRASEDAAASDFGSVDLKGKVALVLSGQREGGTGMPPQVATRMKAQAAADRGAVAMAIITPKSDENPAFVRGTVRTGSLPVILIRRSVAERLLAGAGIQLADLEKKAAAGPCPTPTGVRFDLQTDLLPVQRVTANIAGLLPGSDPALRDEIVVVGGHMDHIGMGQVGTMPGDPRTQVHPGADDNASGSAGVLALAEHFGALKERPARSILFICFSGEEEGLFGSEHYVAHPIRPLERTEAMVNLDMVGRMKNNHLSLNGVGTSPAWRAMVNEANRTRYFNIGYADQIGGGSDHEPFGAHRVPVLFFFAGNHPDYHRPTDTPDKINRLDEARIISLTADIVARLAWDRERIAWSDPSAEAPRPMRTGLGVSLGIMPDFGASGDGVHLAGVSPGGAGEKAGLRVGDAILKIGNASIHGMEDYMAALVGHKPGDVVQLTVLRSGAQIKIDAALGAPRQ